MGLLTQPLNPLSGQTDADGQEFQRTLDDQGEVEIYFQCYVALLADRREALINERTLLAAHTLREKQGRHTKAAMKAASAAAAAADDLIMETPEGLEIEPKHEVMHSDMTLKRKKLLLKLNGRAVRSVSNKSYWLWLLD
jgi:E3 ubiquitin-protein ligase SHPRH